ncbi:MAG: hypothetical protein ACLFPL_00025 [Candidatus Nanoarchaeia archaeon]
MNSFNGIIKLMTSVMLILAIFVAGCTQNDIVSNENAQSEESTQRGIEGGTDSNESDVARRESVDVDETQDQINEALTTLTETGTYSYHAGENTIQVEIKVDENNIIQSAQIINYDNLDSASQMWNDRYNEGIEAEVVGVSLSEAQSPEKVNGSSETSAGFNEALEKLRNQQS